VYYSGFHPETNAEEKGQNFGSRISIRTSAMVCTLLPSPYRPSRSPGNRIPRRYRRIFRTLLSAATMSFLSLSLSLSLCRSASVSSFLRFLSISPSVHGAPFEGAREQCTSPLDITALGFYEKMGSKHRRRTHSRLKQYHFIPSVPARPPSSFARITCLAATGTASTFRVASHRWATSSSYSVLWVTTIPESVRLGGRRAAR